MAGTEGFADYANNNKNETSINNDNNNDLREPMLTRDGRQGGDVGREPWRTVVRPSSSADVVVRPPKHAFQLRMKGLVDAVFPPSSEEEEQQLITLPTASSYHHSDVAATNGDNTDSCDDDDLEVELQRELVGLWGRPYVSCIGGNSSNNIPAFLRSSFTCAIVGCIVGFVSIVFILFTQYGCCHYFYKNSLLDSETKGMIGTTMFSLNSSTKKSILQRHRPLWIPLMGGILLGLVGIMHVIVNKSCTLTVPTMFHNLARLGQPQSSSVTTSILAIIASAIALTTGAPLGPELAITTMTSMISNLLAPLSSIRDQAATTNNNSSNHNNITSDHQQNRRLRASCMQASLAASISSILYIIGNLMSSGIQQSLYFGPSLILGSLFVHELSLISHPNTQTVDAQLIRSNHINRRRTKNGIRNRRRQQQQQLDGVEGEGIEEEALGFDHVPTSGILTASTTSEYGIPLPPPPPTTNHITRSEAQQALRPNEHDYMEMLTFQLIASASAVGFIQLLVYCFVRFSQWNVWLLLNANNEDERYNSSFVSSSYYDKDDDDSLLSTQQMNTAFKVEDWQMIAAVPIGILCGIVSSTILAVLGICLVIRQRIADKCQSSFVGMCLLAFLLPIMACLIHGILTVDVTHENAGIGLSLLRQTFNDTMHGNTTNLFSAASGSSADISKPMFWFIAGSVRSISLVICLGLGGLVGGIVVPILVIGLCFGAWIGLSFNMLSTSFTIPCCVAACTVAICPTPFTAALAIAIFFVPHTNNNAVTMMGPIFVACISAWAITGGFGIIQYFGTRRVSSIRCSRRRHARRLRGVHDGDEYNYMDVNNDNNFDGSYYDSNNNDFSRVSDDEIIRDVRSTIFGNG